MLTIIFMSLSLCLLFLQGMSVIIFGKHFQPSAANAVLYILHEPFQKEFCVTDFLHTSGMPGPGQHVLQI